MVGGGNNAFIGAVHHAAALMDNRIELVCGCFSSHPDISLASGREYFLPDNRIYFSHAEMIEKESALPDGERMDFISIVTPNVTHFEPAMMALDKGFDVVIEKPMTFTLEQAKQLRQKVMQTGRTLALTQTYSAYPAVKEARERFAKGEFGTVRKIYVEYPQGWLTTRIELNPGSNAAWRTDPQAFGQGGMHGRHRDACAASGRVHIGASVYGDVCRPHHIPSGARTRGRRRRPAAFRQRRAGHTDGLAGGRG